MWDSASGGSQADGLLFQSFFRGFGVGLLETVPQLYLTTSLFGLAFEYSNTGMKVFQLMSLGLSALSILKLVFSVLTPDVRGAIENCTLSSFEWFAFLTFPSVAFTILCVCAARVYHAYQCESHLWNFTTGCVEVAGS